MGKKGDDVEQISLIEKEDDKEDGGMGSYVKQRYDSRLVSSQNFELLMLQETKKGVWSLEEIRKLGQSGEIRCRWNNVEDKVTFVNVFAPWSVPQHLELLESYGN
ncbi:hypothetical protein V6N12_062647 [Hibiscus sabdariffa]|uniref:Uncharacterized protein n=1 Tax=Hibiscus sabdariffa TaxID=183260 RepID=A0ABR2F9G3_9ROSI